MSSKEKCEMNIQAFVRIRPFNHLEKKYKVLEHTVNEVVVKGQLERQPKVFSFDKVFGSETKQVDVYNEVVKPMVAEVLAGYNCTVFAYGQTGSGKTFTMMGENDFDGRNTDEAGIIPRALDELFDELKTNTDGYFVRVSYVELYNEELIDLLSVSTDKSKIRIFEDATKKGSVIVSGITDVPVNSKEDVFKIIQKGSSKRHTASTLLNEQSSRSHSLFTITVHVKDTGIDGGEDYIKMAKLNLVDLAGSENIGRSGAVDKRFREASNINTSLLTLGRVITALVEKTPHVPYRESKLTRLLQDSLGGHTKTSIIATVSPAGCNLEESLSTLDYACRAKFITNKPVINKKVATKHLLKDYMEEIERLKRDLQACRDKTGIYIAHENYELMTRQLNDNHKILDEKVKVIEELKDVIHNKEHMLSAMNISYKEKCNALDDAKNALTGLEAIVKETTLELKEAEAKVEEQKYLVKKYCETERKLTEQAIELKTVASLASSDTYKLHDKIERTMSVERFNKEKLNEFSNNFAKTLIKIQEMNHDFASVHLHFNKTQKNKLSSKYNEVVDYTSSMNDGLSQMMATIGSRIQQILECGNNMKGDLASFIEKQTNLTEEILTVMSKAIGEFFSDILQPCLITVGKNLNDLEKNRIQLEREMITMNDKFTVINQENVELKEKVHNVESVFKNYVNHIEEKLKASQECRVLALTETMKQQDKLQKCTAEITKIMDSMNSCVTEDPVHNIIVKQKQTLEDCESTALNMNEKCEQLFNDVLYKCDEMNSNLLENANALQTVHNEFHEQANAHITSSISSKKEAEIEFEGFMTRHVKSWDNYEQIAADSLAELSTGIHNDVQNFIEGSQCLNDVMKSGVEKLIVSTREHLGQYEEYLRTEGEEFAKVEKEVSDCKETAAHTLHKSMDLVNKLFAEDLKCDVPTGSTPQHKEFRFPTDLIATSPHERILQRFRREYSLLSETGRDDVFTQETVQTHTQVVEKPSRQNSKEQVFSVSDESSLLSNDSVVIICEENKENLSSKTKKKHMQINDTKNSKCRSALNEKN